MNGELLWNRITSELHQTEVELITLGQGLWFKAYADNNKIYVDKAAEHVPSCKMSMQRPVSKNDFLLVYSYYDRWLSGEIGARHEVSRKSRNTAYIFALINKFYKQDKVGDLAGVSLGELISIDYNWGELHLYSQTIYDTDEKCMKMSTSCAPDIEPDDIDVSDSVSFVWELK